MCPYRVGMPPWPTSSVLVNGHVTVILLEHVRVCLNLLIQSVYQSVSLLSGN